MERLECTATSGPYAFLRLSAGDRASPLPPMYNSSIQGSVPDKGDLEGDLEGDLINDPRLLQLLDLAEGEGDAAETARADLYTQFGIEVDPAPSETQEAHV